MPRLAHCESRTAGSCGCGWKYCRRRPRASACCGSRVVDAHHNLPREHVLNSEVPLIDLGIPRRPSVQVAGVAETPLCQLAVFGSLRRCETAGKWAGATGRLCRGRPKASKLVCEIVFGEEHTRRFRECRTGVLEISGYVHAIEDSCATAQYRIGSKLIGEAKARSEVVSVHRRVATTGTWEEARASDLANLSKVKLRVVGVQVATERNVDSCVSSEIVELEAVESLGVGSTPLVAQSEIQSQLGRSLPVIQHEERGVLRFVRHGGNYVKGGVMRIPGQDRGKRVALSMIIVSQAVIGLKGGHIAGEVENAGGVIGLPKVIKEDALLSSKLDGMSTFYPLQSRGVAEQRVGEVGIHAALRKQREERVIDTNRRHAGEPAVRGKDWR